MKTLSGWQGCFRTKASRGQFHKTFTSVRPCLHGVGDPGLVG